MIEMYTNREVTRWLRLMADLEHAAEPEFPGESPAANAALPQRGGNVAPSDPAEGVRLGAMGATERETYRV